MQKPLVAYRLFSQELKDVGGQAGFRGNLNSYLPLPAPCLPGTRLILAPEGTALPPVSYEPVKAYDKGWQYQLCNRS